MKTRTTIPALLTISIDRSRVARPLRLIRLGKLLLIGAVFMGGVSGAAADNPERLASMVEQMRTGKTELSTLKGQEDDLTAQNESSLKEVAAYQSSFGQLESEKKAKLENSPVIKDAKRRLKSADDMVEEWNSHYAKDRVGPLPEATYNEGLRRKGQVEHVVVAIRTDVQHSLENFQRTEIAPIEAIQARQRKAIEVLTARIKANFATWEKLKARSDALEKKLQALRTSLVGECTAASTIESLKYCSSIGWDNMRKDLPPLTKIQPPFGATVNP
jgi:uncharacterized coiled-coil protein SlyX